MNYNRFSLLRYFLKGSMKWFGLSIICTCAVTFLDMLGPKIIEYTFDYVLGGADTRDAGIVSAVTELLGGAAYLRENFHVIAILVAAVAAGSALFRYLFRLFDSLGAEHLVKRMREKIFSQIMGLPYLWHTKNMTGDIIQRATSDVETVKVFLSEQFTELFRTVILLIFAFTFMAGIDPVMTVVAGLFLPVVVLYSLFFYHRIGDAFERADEREGVLSAMCQENLAGVRVVRAFGRERYEQERFKNYNDGYTLMWVKLMRLLSAYWSVGDFFTGIQMLTCILLGVYNCVNGNITSGEFIAFISYNGMMIWPVRALGRVISDMSKAGVSIDRIAYIMNSVKESEEGEPWQEKSDVAIEFSNVSFSYPGTDKKVLDDVSFSLKEGETLGIIGATGSGKSTLAGVLTGLLPIEEGMGVVKVYGQEISDISGRTLRSHAGMVLQEGYLFSRSLYDNLVIADQSADRARVERAVRTAALDGAIESLKDGYDTVVGEKGVTLSGGQRQRVQIAQLLIKDTKIMIFDDSLSAVDTGTDLRIRSALKEEMAGKTVVLIAHRISTVMDADKIIVLNHGRIVESGDHDSLMAQGGVYRKIYELQTAAGAGAV